MGSNVDELRRFDIPGIMIVRGLYFYGFAEQVYISIIARAGINIFGIASRVDNDVIEHNIHRNGFCIDADTIRTRIDNGVVDEFKTWPGSVSFIAENSCTTRS